MSAKPSTVTNMHSLKDQFGSSNLSTAGKSILEGGPGQMEVKRVFHSNPSQAQVEQTVP